MSRTIDQRVVEMQFNNKDFEKNASQSLSTIEKLKAKLDFSGSAKAMKELNGSVKDVDMSPLSSAADAVKSKFSALEEIGIGALRRIGEQAVSTGEQLIKSLSTDNIAAGWNKFGEETRAVGTLISQGFDLEEVEEQLAQLQFFTDETSYNFVDMVSEIGKFTAAGQGLKESNMALQGIASWAAMSGQNAQTASRAMYQLSQAMGSGIMRKEDYKSIQNANMDTRQFRQAAIDAALALGTLQEVSDGVYKSSFFNPKNIEDSYFTIDQFADHLTEDAWFTSDVMMMVYRDYGKAALGIQKYMESIETDTASDAIDNIERKAKEFAEEMVSLGQASNVNEAMNAALQKASLDQMMGDPEKIEEAKAFMDEYNSSLEEGQQKIESYEDAFIEMGYVVDEFSLQAFKAGQEARTWEDTLDSVKDAVSSKWSASFKNIFGNYDEAKTLWTKLANDFYDIFAASGDARNEMLDVWKELGGRDLLFSADEENLGSILRIVEAIKNIMATITDAANELFYGTSKGSEVAEAKGKNLFNITKKISEAINRITDKFKEGSESLEKLKRTFKGVFAIVDIVKIAVSELFSAIGNVIGALTGDANGGILDITASAGDAIVAFRDWIKQSGIFKTVFGAVGNTIVRIVNLVKQFIEWFRSIPLVSNAIEAVKSAFESLKNTISDLFNKVQNGDSIGDVFNEFFKDVKIVQDIKNIFAGIWNAIKGFWNQFAEVPKSFSEVNKFLADTFVGISNTFKSFLNTIGITSDSIGNIFNRIKDMFSNMTINDWAMVAVGVAIFLFIRKLLSAVNSVGSIADALKNLTSAINGFFGGIKKTLQAHAVLVMAGSILVLVGALSVLATQDPDRLWGAVGAMAALIGLVTAMFLVVGLVGKRLGAASVAIAGLTAAMTLLSVSLAILGNTNMNGAARAALVLSGFVTWLLLIVTIASRLVSNRDNVMKNMFGLAVTIASVGAAMFLMTLAIKKLAEFDAGQMEKVGLVLLQIAGALALVVAASSFVRKGGAATTILSAVLSLYLIVGAIKRLNALDPKAAANGLLTIKQIFLMYASTLAIIGAASLGRGTKGVGATIVAITTSIYGIMGAVLLLGLIPSDMLERGLSAVQGLMLVISVVVLAAGIAARIAKGAQNAEGDAKDATNSISQLGNLLIKMALAISMISVAIAGLSVVAHFNPDGFTSALVAVSIITALFGAIVGVSALAKDSAKSLGAINTAIITLAITVGALSLIGKDNLAGVIVAASGLSLVMASLSVIIFQAKNMRVKMKDFIGLTIVVAVLGAVVGALSIIAQNNLGGAIVAAAGLTLVMAAFAVVIYQIQNLGNVSMKQLLPILGAVAILGVIMAGLAYGISFLNGMDFVDVLGKIAAISIVFAELIAATLLLSKFGSFAGGALASIGILVVVTGLLAFILYNMNGLDATNAILNATALTILMAGLSVALLASIVVGKFAEAATSAIVPIATFLLVLAGIISIAGLILSVPGTQEIFEKGVDLMRIIGESIGAFFGGIVGGFQKAASAGKMEQIGKDMAKFYEATSTISDTDHLDKMIELANSFGKLGANVADASKVDGLADTFAEITKFAPDLSKIATEFSALKINSDNVSAVVKVGEMIAALANALPSHDGLAQVIGGDNTLSKFGADMRSYAIYVKQFVQELDGVDIDESAVNAAACVGRIMASLGNSLPAHDGVAQILGGDNTLANFGADMRSYAIYVKQFVKELEGVTIDQNAVDAAACVGRIMASLGNSLPAHDGLAQILGGDNTLSGFGADMRSYAIYVKQFAEELRGVDIDIGTVELAEHVGQVMAALANDLPVKNNDFWAFFTGSQQSLSDFGSELPEVGKGIKNFSDEITKGTGIDAGAIDAATNALSVLTAIENNLPETGHAFSWLTGGDKDLNGFVNDMPKFAEGIRKFSNELLKDGGINTESVTAAAETMSALSSLSQVGQLPDFSGMTQQLIPMAENLKKYSDILGEGEFSVDAIENAGNAAQALVSLEKSLSSTSFNKSTLAFSKISDLVYLLNRVSMLDSEKIEAFSNILTGIGTNGINSFLSAMNEQSNALEQSAITILNSFISGVENNQNEFSDVFIKICDAGIQAIKSKTEEFKATGQEAADVIMSGMTSKLESDEDGIKSQVENSMGNVFGGDFGGFDVASKMLGGMDLSSIQNVVTAPDGLLGNLSGALSSSESTGMLNGIGTDMFGGMMGGIDVGSITDSVTGEGGLLGNLGAALSSPDSMGMLNGFGSDMLNGITDGFDMSKITETATGKGGILDTFSGALSGKEATEQYADVGENAAQGFIDGTSTKLPDIKQAGVDIAEKYMSGITETLDEHSPSKETYKLGAYAGEGFLNALSEYIGMSYDSGAMLSDSTLDGMMTALNSAMTNFDTNVDVQPTITPVVDLSNVDASAAAINEVFGPDSRIGVTGNITAIAGDITNLSTLNVDNSDVVTELDRLRGDMRLMGEKLSNLQVMLDTGVLVGSLADPMDSALGSRAYRKKRG